MPKVLMFDTWGTLVDNYSIADVIEPHVGESHVAQRIAQDWRFQQKWAMFYLTLCDSFVPHPTLNEACLKWALDRHHVELPPEIIDTINAQYHRLRAYPDVVDALKALKAQGLTLKIIANPTKQMIEDHSKFAGTFEHIDEIISSGEEAQAFKPSPKVYELGIRRAGCAKEDILWVTGHFWEVVGARRQGLAVAWTNRARQPRLDIGVEPTYTTRNLQELADILATHSTSAWSRPTPSGTCRSSPTSSRRSSSYRHARRSDAMTDEWYYEQFENHTRLGMQVKRRLVSERSDFQKIELFEAERYGRVLALDGVYQTSELEEYFYHEMLVHPAMTSAPRIRRALVIGGGDGGTAREVLKHPEVEQCVMVEIDARVVDACKAHLPTIGTAWDDPRLDLRIGDGIVFVKEADTEPFDVIFIDGSDPIGPNIGLYDEAFYRGCARVLAPDGILVLQSESPFLIPDIFLQIQETLGRVFDRVDPYFGPAPIYGCGIWSWTCASRGIDPIAIVDARAEHIEAQSRYYNRDIHRGAFALPNDLRR